MYKDNKDYIPSFVTTDSVLHIYHIFYDFLLRKLEAEEFLPKLEALNDGLLKKSIEVYNQVKNPQLKKAALLNCAYFAAGQKLLNKPLPKRLPKEAAKLAATDFKNVNAVFGKNALSLPWPNVDFTQFTVRGHYTRSPELSNYFKTIMWYGQLGFFALNYESDNKDYFKNPRNEFIMMRALMISKLVSDSPEFLKSWESLYEPICFFVGEADDLSVKEFASLIKSVYGEKADYNDFADNEKMNSFYTELFKLPMPKVQKHKGYNVRLFSQRTVFDAEVFETLVDMARFGSPSRMPLASGLDVMAALGSKTAKEIQLNEPVNQKWEEYAPRLENEIKRVAAIPETEMQKNIYTKWITIVKLFAESTPKNYPEFMQSDAWSKKNLNSALGSWAELKHDTVLYAKQIDPRVETSATPVVPSDEQEPPKSYVEPSIKICEALKKLIEDSAAVLKEKDLLKDDTEYYLQRFSGLISFFIDCSKKELANKPLSSDEYEQLNTIGKTLEGISMLFVEGSLRKWYQIENETDRNMAIISDLYRIPTNIFNITGFLETGIGPAYIIYVAVPIEGKLYLTRGAVFSYYEFAHDERLTDEKWQAMLKNKKAPEHPGWLKTIMAE